MSRYTGNYNIVNPSRKIFPLIVGAFVIGIVIGGIIGGVGGVLTFIRITGANDQPSAPISAPTLSVSLLQTSTPNVTSAILSTATSAASEPLGTSLVSPILSTETPLPPRLYRIVSEESVAQFSVDETIPAGTAIGTTNQVAGDFIIDFANAANSQLGIIRINLRTLQTNDAERDKSIRCCVLLSAQDAYEFTEFVPTSLLALPQQVTFGQTVAFQVVGNLSLRGVTQPVTFNVSLALDNAETISGQAIAVVKRSDFGILDDDMLVYHGVAQDITLRFNFVARSPAQ